METKLDVDKACKAVTDLNETLLKIPFTRIISLHM